MATPLSTVSRDCGERQRFQQAFPRPGFPSFCSLFPRPSADALLIGWRGLVVGFRSDSGAPARLRRCWPRLGAAVPGSGFGRPRCGLFRPAAAAAGLSCQAREANKKAPRRARGAFGPGQTPWPGIASIGGALSAPICLCGFLCVDPSVWLQWPLEPLWLNRSLPIRTPSPGPPWRCRPPGRCGSGPRCVRWPWWGP